MFNRERKIPLEIAAQITPAFDNSFAQFRCIAHMYDKVDLDLLNKACEHTFNRFKPFNAVVKKGFFTVNFAMREFVLKAGEYSPKYRKFNLEEESPLIRVSVGDKLICCEFHHSITDGNGGMEFLNCLVGCYMHLKGELKSFDRIKDYRQKPAADEFEDGYLRYGKGFGSLPAAKGKVYKIQGEKLPEEQSHIATYVFNAEQLSGKSKEYGCTVQAVLATAVSTAFELAKGNMDKRVVKIQMPIDLRKRFASRTVRNYAATAMLRIGGENKSFSERCLLAKDAITCAVDNDALGKFISTTRKASKLGVICPVPIRYSLVRLANKFVGEGGASCSLSNIGIIDTPVTLTGGYADIPLYKAGRLICR